MVRKTRMYVVFRHRAISEECIVDLGIALTNSIPPAASAVLLIPEMRLAARRADANAVEPAGEGRLRSASRAASVALLLVGPGLGAVRQLVQRHVVVGAAVLPGLEAESRVCGYCVDHREGGTEEREEFGGEYGWYGDSG